MDFVKIQGYKSFKKIAVCLHPINLLIGANGAGKSNFLSLYNPQNEMFSHFGTKRYNFKNETQLFKVIPHTSKNQKKSTGFAGTKYI